MEDPAVPALEVQPLSHSVNAVERVVPVFGQVAIGVRSQSLSAGHLQAHARRRYHQWAGICSQDSPARGLTSASTLRPLAEARPGSLPRLPVYLAETLIMPGLEGTIAANEAPDSWAGRTRKFTPAAGFLPMVHF